MKRLTLFTYLDSVESFILKDSDDRFYALKRVLNNLLLYHFDIKTQSVNDALLPSNKYTFSLPNLSLLEDFIDNVVFFNLFNEKKFSKYLFVKKQADPIFLMLNNVDDLIFTHEGIQLPICNHCMVADAKRVVAKEIGDKFSCSFLHCGSKQSKVTFLTSL
ncbi:hypothetical protein [Halobacteriovorax sp. ZH2_bin.1]|uniref:hypothetical protein n=1 Tax=unclassified Halobacteriovorax TaxID=2639665 RepID=UPI0037148D55